MWDKPMKTKRQKRLHRERHNSPTLFAKNVKISKIFNFFASKKIQELLHRSATIENENSCLMIFWIHHFSNLIMPRLHAPGGKVWAQHNSQQSLGFNENVRLFTSARGERETCPFWKTQNQTHNKSLETENRHGFQKFILTFSIWHSQPSLLTLSTLALALGGRKNNAPHFKSNYVLIFLDKRQSCMGDNLITGELGKYEVFLVIWDNCF